MPCPAQPATSADRLVASYRYELPPEAIAQVPVEPRDRARMMVVSATDSRHECFGDLPRWLDPGDLLVLNDTRVIPARLFGRKPTGRRVEVLLLEQQTVDTWLALVKPGRRIPVGTELEFAQHTSATVIATDPPTGGRLLQFRWPSEQTFADILDSLGEIPFPPYITQRSASDDRYQTVYATRPGAVAAPTAGLHFTPTLLQNLQQKGIATATVTLHVGLGTFRPVEVESIESHQMHGEWVDVPASTADAIRQTQQKGGRIIAVGTTVARSLETAAQSGTIQPFQGKSHLFIYPGYQWQVLDGLITNFHLPQSTLLMMLSALIGRSRLLDLYTEALQQGYRFYSFGDGMLVLPTHCASPNS